MCPPHQKWITSKAEKLPADAVLVLNREQEEMQPDFTLKLINENVVSN